MWRKFALSKDEKRNEQTGRVRDAIPEEEYMSRNSNNTNKRSSDPMLYGLRSKGTNSLEQTKKTIDEADLEDTRNFSSNKPVEPLQDVVASGKKSMAPQYMESTIKGIVQSPNTTPFAAYMPTIDSGEVGYKEGDDNLLASTEDFKLFESAAKDRRDSADIAIKRLDEEDDKGLSKTTPTV